MMNWIARQPFIRVVLMAAAWPLLLIFYALLFVILPVLDGALPVGFRVAVASWPLLFLTVFGPSLAVGAMWWFARKLSPPAT